MKKFLLVFSVLVIFNLYCFAEVTPDSIWGVWDIDHDEYTYESLQMVNADGIEYLRMTWELLIFEKNSDGKSVIWEQGGGCDLLDYYQKNSKTIILCIRTIGDNMLYGEVAMHFIDENHVWFEVLKPTKNNTNLPLITDFKDSKKILTRMPTIASLNIPVITLNEGDLMYCNDNLRLRTEHSIHSSDSKVIVCMKKGTKVKVVQKYNWPGYIDGVVSDWVEVEVIEDSFDKDGKPLPKGTRGWCFGAYLTLIDDGSK